MFYYLQKEALKSGEVVVVLQTKTAIPNYKEIVNQGELVEFEGDNLPSQWEYNEQEDYLYDVKDKPSPYHILKNKEWVVQDIEGFKKYCNENIDKIKAETLEYGFDYNGHRQIIREKDINLLNSNALSLFLSKAVLGKDEEALWVYQDNFKQKMNLVEIVTFMMFGKKFMDSVYETESHFKNLEEPKPITKEEFETKRKEIHQALVQGE